MSDDDIVIRAIDGPDQCAACAAIMASTDPWKRLGRDAEVNLKTVTHSTAFVAVAGDEIVGLVLVALNIPLIRGYIVGLAVKEAFRGKGIGTRLLAFAEAQTFRQFPNVFLCVSTFNIDAQRFYERQGYHRIGVIENFAIEGEGEILLRKTLGPYSTFTPKT
jgi:ribosomal protein S18 acetylase RimI-like enzyme